MVGYAAWAGAVRVRLMPAEVCDSIDPRRRGLVSLKAFFIAIS